MSKKPTLAEMQQQIADLTEALQRERADAVNVKRRAEEDKSRMGDFYKVMIMRDFLPALDNLERAMSHKPKDSSLTASGLGLKTLKDWVNGVESIGVQFDKVFEKLGIERVKTVGEPFDPKLHEAISVEDGTDGRLPAGRQVEVVCEELQPGYKMGEEVIRHALVKVKTHKEK